MDNFNEQESVIIDGINTARDACHYTAVEKGWWRTTRSTPECLMLMVSEISEALEEYRNNAEAYYVKDGKPEGVAVELADAMIRILDYCGFYNINIGEIMIEKMRYNETRPYRHGNKEC